MTKLESAAFIGINGEVVNVASVFATLQLFGQFQPMIRNYLQDYILQKEFQDRDDLNVTSSDLSQRVIDFRLANGLNDSGVFEQWLASQGIDYSIFEQQVIVQLKLERLKNAVTKPEVQSLYSQTPMVWDKVDLIYLTTSDEAIASKLRTKLDSGNTFEAVYQEFSSACELPQVILRRDLIRRNKLKPEIKAAVETATCKEILGPVQMGEHWCLCSVQTIISSSLDDQVTQELQELVFTQWMEEKLKQLKIVAPETLTQAQSGMESIQENYAESAA